MRHAGLRARGGHMDIASDPADVGIDRSRLDAVDERIQQEIDEGRLPGAQGAVGRQGQVAAFRAFGDATVDALFCMFSATKVLVASAVWLLLQEGRITTATKVADVVPEFGTNGKDIVTLEHVMLHTGGFPLAPYAPSEWNDRDVRRQRFSQWRLDWEPGTKYQSHATSAHWVLADIIERITGDDFRQHVRERVLLPYGVDDMYVGMPKDQDHRYRPITHVGEPLSADELKEMGFPVIPEGEVTEEAITNFNEPEIRRAGVPGGGGVATAAQIALFYQRLLEDLEGAGRLFKKDFLEDVMVVRTGALADPFTKVPANRGLGVILAGDAGLANWPGFGKTQSARTYGHYVTSGQLADGSS